MPTGNAIQAAAPRSGIAGWTDKALALASHGPLGVVLRAAAVTAAALGAAWVHRYHDPGVLCPLRRFTGVPCPFCGGTTVFIELGSGDLLGALAANPVVLLGTFGVVAAPVRLGGFWWELPARARNRVLGTAVALAWLWQLHRFGFLRF